MKRSVDRILTTHTGSLIRPPQLLEFVKARQAGQAVDQSAYEATLQDSGRDVVARQVEAGNDIPYDGAFGKSTNWPLYVLKRRGGSYMAGAEGANPFARGGGTHRIAYV